MELRLTHLLQQGWTALHRAAFGGHAAVVSLLLADPALDPNATTMVRRHHQYVKLHHACPSILCRVDLVG